MPMTAAPTHDLADALKALARGEPLDAAMLEGAFNALLTGEAAPEQVGAFLMGLAVRGETSRELLAGARIMRQHARQVRVDPPLLDTCGTGGLAWKSLNTSTASALVLAASGVRVAKHGNRSVPPKTGSADVLEALGVNLDVDEATFRACLDGAGVAFLFARSHHSAMRHVAPIRSSLGIRTVFNLLGPLTNPANASHQVLGVYDERWLEPMAETLAALGVTRAWVVHGVDGLDEVSIAGTTRVAEVRDGAVRLFDVTPEEAGLDRAPLSSLEGGSVDDNARAILDLLDGQEGPFRDVVLMNAAAGLVVTGHEATLRAGVQRAARALDDGKAANTLTRLVNLSHGREPS